MVAVAPDHHGDVFVAVLTEVAAVVVGVLGDEPLVEAFVHHHQPQFVAGIEEMLRGQVVAAAHGVESLPLDELQLTCFGPVEGGGPQQAVVVVHAAAPDEHGLAVEAEALFGRKLQRAQPDAFGEAVGHAAVGPQQADFRRVEIGVVGAPGACALQSERGGGVALLPRSESQRL